MKLLIDFLLVFGISVNGIILLVLFQRKKTQLQHVLFMGVFLILLLLLITSYGIYKEIRWLQYAAIVLGGISYLLGPLIYLYFKSLASKKDGFLKRNFVHLIPFIAYFLIITTPILISAVQKEYIFSYLVFINDHSYVADIIEIAFVLFYLVISLRVFFKMKTLLKNVFSTIEYKNIQWIEILVYGLMICSIIQVIVLSLEAAAGSSDYLDLTFIIAYVGLICYLGYFGIQQPDVSVKLVDNAVTISENNAVVDKRKYMSTAEIEDVNNKISQVFNMDKPYLNEDLTLGKLATLLDTSDKKLSYYLNSHLETSFYDFVNSYRIEEFKHKLKNNEHHNFSILGLAYDSGFKSKSSFNRIFKKETGVSPTAFLKTL